MWAQCFHHNIEILLISGCCEDSGGWSMHPREIWDPLFCFFKLLGPQGTSQPCTVFKAWVFPSFFIPSFLCILTSVMRDGAFLKISPNGSITELLVYERAHTYQWQWRCAFKMSVLANDYYTCLFTWKQIASVHKVVRITFALKCLVLLKQYFFSSKSKRCFNEPWIDGQRSLSQTSSLKNL